jgi:hypothetical protein
MPDRPETLVSVVIYIYKRPFFTLDITKIRSLRRMPGLPLFELSCGGVYLQLLFIQHHSSQCSGRISMRFRIISTVLFLHF